MRIGILQTGQSPEPLREAAGDYPDMFVALLAPYGFNLVTYNVEQMQFPNDLQECDGWLITGSRHGAYEDHAFIPPLEDFIRKVMAAHIPLVGICFGHQIIAQAMGGKVERYEGGWAVGPQSYDFGGEAITLNAWHRDQVTKLPDGAKVIACNDFCANAALVYGDTAFSVQAHPEFKDDFVDGLMTTRGPGVVPDSLMAEAREKLGQGNDSQAIAARIAAFFQRQG
ncbi:GMP synthase-like glutamine amidotransferase [Rhodobacter aestuarii]|uniref:GMP synthase-Glutamine amidotransferase n=1 Tax=Rhodobacter aestuarii TaxID=453582 RepID=A0A1N7MVV9_9RHOB|nr:type 1 glutamine amidotransferase [Rhodobacter aestuarii]PTV96495.1 GMP synthase-like glutamine amidotransferase [Rhodobacter aestuarii]SIS90222.1 GMP synthase-Glutamine amidotransferase [Rhodobacter aestuarii]